MIKMFHTHGWVEQWGSWRRIISQVEPATVLIPNNSELSRGSLFSADKERNLDSAVCGLVSAFSSHETQDPKESLRD